MYSSLPVKDPKKPGIWTFSNDFKELRKMAKLKFRVKHRGKQDDKKDCKSLPPTSLPLFFLLRFCLSKVFELI